MGYIGIMEKKMETTIGFRVGGGASPKFLYSDETSEFQYVRCIDVALPCNAIILHSI